MRKELLTTKRHMYLYECNNGHGIHLDKLHILFVSKLWKNKLTSTINIRKLIIFILTILEYSRVNRIILFNYNLRAQYWILFTYQLLSINCTLETKQKTKQQNYTGNFILQLGCIDMLYVLYI